MDSSGLDERRDDAKTPDEHLQDSLSEGETGKEDVEPPPPNPEPAPTQPSVEPSEKIRKESAAAKPSETSEPVKVSSTDKKHRHERKPADPSSPSSTSKKLHKTPATSSSRKSVNSLPSSPIPGAGMSNSAAGVTVAIEEMRRYYESEIAILRRQVQGIYGENAIAEDSLLKRCHALEAQLRSAHNEAELLREQVNGLKSQMESWPVRVHELECEKDNLRIRLDEVRQNNHQKEQEIIDAQERLRSMEEKVVSQTTSPHDHILLQRMMEEYDNLAKDYDLVKAALLSTEHKLYNARSELSEHTRRLAQMELDLRKVESENNYLRRRALQDRDRATASPTKNSPPWFLSKVGEGSGLSTYERDFTPMSTLLKERSRVSIAAERDNSTLTTSMYAGNSDTLGKMSLESNEDRLSRQHTSRMSVRGPAQRSLSVAKTGILPGGSAPSDIPLGTSTLPRNHATTHNIDTSGSFMRSPSADRAMQNKFGMDIQELRQRYDELHMRKRKLETALSHLPTNSRNKHQVRQQKESLEEELDHVDHDLGALRMTLRQFNAL